MPCPFLQTIVFFYLHWEFQSLGWIEEVNFYFTSENHGVYTNSGNVFPEKKCPKFRGFPKTLPSDMMRSASEEPRLC